MKVMMVGLGGAGQRHMRILKDLLGNEAEFIAYRVRGRRYEIRPDFKIDEAVSVEKKYGITSYNDLSEALDQKPEIAVLANPSAYHIPVSQEIAETGCHMLIEKPLSHTMDGVDKLTETVEKKGTVAMVGYQMRFHPCLQYIKELLNEERLGDVITANLMVHSHVPSWHPYEDYRNLYAVRRDMGGGVLLTESHEPDYANWFFGTPKNVYAVGGKLSSADIDVEDTASLALRCSKGGREFPVHIDMSFMSRPDMRGCDIAFEKGSVKWEGGTQVSVYEGQKWTHKNYDGFERIHLFNDQMKHFLACVRGEEKPLVDLQQGVSALKVALAARKSIDSGNPEAI